MGVALFFILIILGFGGVHYRLQYRYREIVRHEQEKNKCALNNYKNVANKTKRKLNEKNITAHTLNR